MYSSTDHKTDASDESLADPNTYLPFKIVDTVVTKRIGEELDALSEEDDEGKPVNFRLAEILYADRLH